MADGDPDQAADRGHQQERGRRLERDHPHDPHGEHAEAADALDPGPDVTEADDRRDRRVTWQVFLAVGAIITVLTLLYLPSEEAAGIVMLVVAALLAFFCGVFLWRASARLDDEARVAAEGRDPAGAGGPGGHGDPGPAYLPTSSPWPFGIGLGATLVLNGLLIGTWFLVPGAVLLAISIGGFARQSRHRFDR